MTTSVIVRRRTSLVLALVSCLACSSQGDDGGDWRLDPEAEARHREVLSSIADRVILPTYRDFRDAVALLETTTATYAGSLGDTEREEARSAWRGAMGIWQRAEIHRVGPAAPNSTDHPEGRDLRAAIYSWPVVSTCRVDQELAAESYRDAEAFATSPPNVLGLDALEYLLFDESLGNSCAPEAAINAEGTWSALGEEEVRQRRADYAATTASILLGSATELVDAWEPAVGDFRGGLVAAGDGSEAYDSLKDAFDAVYAGLFYMDTDVKDMKLGDPAGLTVTCMAESCPSELESRFAHVSKDHMRSNLVGFQRVFLGGESTEGTGFDDLLRAAGAASLADGMTADVDAALASVDAVNGTFAEALGDDVASVRAVHAAVKKITDSMKSQFQTVLDLQQPMAAGSDDD